MPKTFLRQETNRHSRIGFWRKKLQKWRRPKGIDSKMRLRMKGHSKCPSPGYKSPKKDSGRIQNKIPVLVRTIKDLEKMTKENIAILARVGAKRKVELIKFANEKKIQMLNVPSPDKKIKKKSDNIESKESKKWS